MLESEKGNTIGKGIEDVLRKELNLKEKPCVVVAFTCELTEFMGVHWVSNSHRDDAIKMLSGVIDMLKSGLN